MTSSARLSKRNQAGVALIVTLLLLVFVLSIVGGLFFRHQISLQKLGKSLTSEQAVLLFLSAETWAVDLLAEDRRKNRIDHLDEDWARRLPAMPIEGGKISGCIQDLQSRFNLNNLGWYSNRSWQQELESELTGTDSITRRRLYKNLLEELNLNSEDVRIAALVDWIDGDSWLVSPDSAEDNEYLLQTPAYRAGNFPLTDVSELALVQGYTGADIYQLQYVVNTLPVDTSINVNTASRETILALLDDVTESEISAIAEGRPYETLAEFYQGLAAVINVPVTELQQRIPPGFISVDSEYFLLEAEMELGAVHLAYRSVLQRATTGETHAISRTVRYIPRIQAKDGERSPQITGCRSSEANRV